MTFDKVKEIIVDSLSCDAEKITMEASLMDDLGADSLDAMELNMALEEAFSITIAGEDLATLTTVGSLVNYIDSHK
ncbi:MAG: acyl carrier protein [Lachnospiraceae bacterium]|nr:acyl carrier protein [Lachnospiraceae bacterium]